MYLLAIFVTKKLDWKVELQCFFMSETSENNVQRDLDSPILSYDKIFCPSLRENKTFRSSFHNCDENTF